jgi:hypothetical protein
MRDPVQQTVDGELKMVTSRITIKNGMRREPAFLSRWGDLNPRPADYESAAIPLSHSGNCLTTLYVRN